jgi:uncharacterized caspase-like protein
MNPRIFLLILVPLLALSMAGCKKEEKVDATRPLQESFQTAAPEVKQGIDAVNASLRAGNYAEAARTLSPLVEQRPLTDAQKQAVGVALRQVTLAAESNPALNTREMYELRRKMFETVHSGPRF